MASRKEEFSSDPCSTTTFLPELETLSLKDTPHQELTMQINESLLHVQDHGSFQLDGRGFSLGGSKDIPKKPSPFKRHKFKSSPIVLSKLESLSLEDTPPSKDVTNEGQVSKLLIQVEDNDTLFRLDGRGFNLGSSNEQPRKHRSACHLNKENRYKRSLSPHTTGMKLTRVPFPLNVSHVPELVTESDRIECKARMRKARDEESSSAKVRNIEIENDNSHKKKPVELDDPDVVSPVVKSAVSQHRFSRDQIKQCRSKGGKKIFHSMKVEDLRHEDEKDLSVDPYDSGMKSDQESLRDHTPLKDGDKTKKMVPVDIPGRTLSQIKKRTKTRIHPTEFNNNDIIHVGVYTNEIITKLEHQYDHLTQDLFDTNLYLILIEACKRGSLDMVKYFTTRLSQFFDINKVFVYTYEYIIPVHCKPDTEWIISNTHAKPLGNTILHLAAAHHHLEIVKYIVELGAKVDVVDCCGRTPLMRGIVNLPIVEYLIAAKSNVNHQTQYGMTPLMILGKEPHAKGIVECLLKAGADSTVMDKCGRTCIHYLLPTYRKHEVDLLLANTPLPDSRMGTLSCSGRPLFFYDFKNEEFDLLFLNPHLSLVQKASIKFLYVVAKTKSYQGSLVELLRKAIQYKEENQVKFEYPLLLEAYGNRHEVQTANDIDELIRLSDVEVVLESKLKIEINFQCLLISDRLCGYGSYKSLCIQSDILEIMEAIHQSTSDVSLESPESKENCLKLYKLHVELLHRFAEICGPFLKIKTLITDAIKKAISLFSVFKFELNQDWLDIHSELTHAVVTYCKNTSYSHVHHPTYRPNDDSLAKTWIEYLIGLSSKGHYEWIFPIFKLLYKELNFVYISKGLPTTLFYELIHYIPGCKPVHLQDCVDTCGDHILNVPSMGQYPIHLVPSHLLPTLTSLGPHPDVVDHKGQKPRQNMYNDYRNPLSLYCQCATSIVQYNLCYESLDLPSHVKHFIGLHDPKVHVTQYCKHLGIIRL